MKRCFHSAPEGVVRVPHICCGYPDVLDNKSYPQADPGAYFQLAPALDSAKIDAVSIEDAHRPNDLKPLNRFTRIKVIPGVVAIARSRIETVEQVRHRLEPALQHIEGRRLLAAPDCGLGMLDRETALAKMTNLAAAAHSIAA